MRKAYQCPKCGGTAVIWDPGFSALVCPKDKAPLSSYRTPGSEQSKVTPKKKATAKPTKAKKKNTVKRKTTPKQTAGKKKSS